MKTMQKTVSAFLTFAMLLCMTLTTMPTVFAEDLLSIAEGSNVTVTEGDPLVLTPMKSGVSVNGKWTKDGAAVPGDYISLTGKLTIQSATLNDTGNYTFTADDTNLEPVTVNVTVTSKQGSGTVEILGYSVQDAAGNEIQKVTPGTKCRIVVAVRDGRFTSAPTKYDSYGNTVNVKITSTDSFASPSFGDIKQTNIRMTDKGYEYGILFNDITYLGGENTLAFDISYNDNSVTMTSSSVGISQCQTETQTGAKPTLMVQSVGYGDQNVEAGKTFTLTITSYNTSKTSALTDVTTSISLPTGLMLAEGSNKVLTSQVAAGGSYTTTFQMQADASAETGPVNVTVDYTYYLSGTSEPMSASQMITIPIVQPDRFTFTTMDVPTEAYAGEEAYVSVDFVNKGKGILYNLSAEISGNMDNPGQTQYLGNLQSGTEGSAEFSVLASQPGTINGTIKLTYEDVNGNEKTQTKDFTMTITEMPVYDDFPAVDPGVDMQPETGFSMPWWGWLLIVVGCVVVIVVVVRIVKKRKAKKLALELAEDEEDEDF